MAYLISQMDAAVGFIGIVFVVAIAFVAYIVTFFGARRILASRIESNNLSPAVRLAIQLLSIAVAALVLFGSSVL